MSLHIAAAPGDIAPTVLLPGDPLRAQRAAEALLDTPRLVSTTRGMLAYTGTYQGQPVSIMGSGMGMPSLSIYANELHTHHGVSTMIRVGTAGAMSQRLNVGDLVIAQGASFESAPSAHLTRGAHFPAMADFGLMRALHERARDFVYAQDLHTPIHLGPIHSSNAFYGADPEVGKALVDHGVLAVEMESAELFLLGARLGFRAATILTVSDLVWNGEGMDADARERSCMQMFSIALEAALGAS